MINRLLPLVFAAVVGCFSAQAQTSGWFSSGKAFVETSASVASNGDLQPLWLYANKRGVYTQYRQAEGVVRVRGVLRVADFRYFTMDAGLGLVGKTEKGRSMLHEAFLSGKAFIFDYEVGMKAYSPLAEYDEMTVGNYLMSSGARPTPRVGVGLFDYWSVPMPLPQFQDVIQLRGGVYVGRLFNEDYEEEFTRTHTKDVVFHEKFAYVRIGPWFLKPYLGLVHSVMMGGTLSEVVYGKSKDIPVDFWASFFGNGSDKFGDDLRGESTNAAGAHQGLWDLGVDLDVKPLTAHVYFKMPIADGLGKSFLLNERNKDYYLGAVVSLKDTRFVNRLSVEYVTMSDQAGEGTPDPIGYDKNGVQLVIYPGDLQENEDGWLQNWFYEHFTEEEMAAWREQNDKWPYENLGMAYMFFKDKWNHGCLFGGRQNYLGNGLYPQGWAVEGLSMSSAVFHTQQTVEAYASDEYKWQRLVAFPNIRVNAVTVAVGGEVDRWFNYLFKLTGTKNKGNLIEKYVGGSYSWTPAEDYFFSDAKYEYYGLLRLRREMGKGFTCGADVAWDWGDLYSSFGVRLSARYGIGFKR